MRLFNKLNGLRAVGFSIILIVILILFSCKVTFDKPLLGFLKDVKKGTWFAITESGNNYYDDGKACDFGITDNLIKTFTIKNLANITLNIYSISSTDNTVFNVNTAGTSFSLGAGGTTTFTVKYNNNGDTSRVSEKIRIVSNSKDGKDFNLNVFAGGQTMELTVSPDSGYHLNGHGYNFGYQTSTVNQVLSFTNNEVFDVEIESSTVLADDFISSDMGAVKITVGTSKTLSVSYDPAVTANSSKKTNLVLTDKMGRTYTIVLRGTNLKQPDDPSLVGDLALWLDADTIRTANLKSGTQSISIWPDQSGRYTDGRLDAQAIPSYEPEYIENGINGSPAVDFIGGLDVMRVNGEIFTPSKNITVFMVFSSDIAPNDARPLWGIGFTNLRLWASSGGRYYFYPSGMREDSRNTGLAAGSKQLYTILFDSTLSDDADRLQCFVNNVYMPPTDPVNPTLNVEKNLQDLLIGNYETSPSNRNLGLDGKIAELIYYTKTLNASEITLINDYIKDKYNLW